MVQLKHSLSAEQAQGLLNNTPAAQIQICIVAAAATVCVCVPSLFLLLVLRFSDIILFIQWAGRPMVFRYNRALGRRLTRRIATRVFYCLIDAARAE
jgi:hypothetical protein